MVASGVKPLFVVVIVFNEIKYPEMYNLDCKMDQFGLEMGKIGLKMSNGQIWIKNEQNWTKNE